MTNIAGFSNSFIFLLLCLTIVDCTNSKSNEDKHIDENDQGEFEGRSRDHIARILLGGGVHPEQDDQDKDDDDITAPISIDKLPEEHVKALHTLVDIYQKKIRPVENQFHYEDLKRHLYTDADIFAKPIVLLVGPWSTGKTTIINYILGTENTLEELYVGAEPTTSDFTVLSHGDTHRTVEGIVLASDARKPFSPMEKFGQVFLEHLLGIEMPRDILRNVTFIDTPGILENRRQQERGYPYNDVLRWLVARSDLIFVVFDPTKLDVGTELESLFKQLKGHESVVRIVLNKADSMAEQDLMRVYGTLFWSLAPLINVTEPPRIYVGSFWSKPYSSPELEALLTKEEKSLLKDMRDVMRNQVQNKIASIRQHAIRVRIHALLVDSYLVAFRKNKGMFSAGEEVAEVIADHPDRYNVFKAILSHPNVSKFDLPDKEEYKDFFRINAMNDLKRISEHCSSWSGGCSIDKLNQAIAYDLPALLNKVLQTTKTKKTAKQGHCDKKDKNCKEDKKKINKYRVDASATKKADEESGAGYKKSKNDEGSLPKRSKEEKSDKNKAKNKILAEASPEQNSHHQPKRIETNKIEESEEELEEISSQEAADTEESKEVESEESSQEDEDNDVFRTARAGHEHAASMAETKAMLDTKLACLYRKSCYITGIKPDVSKLTVSKPIKKEVKKEIKEMTEEQKLGNLKFKCKYRIPCYKKQKIPYTKSKIERPKVESQSSKHKKEDKRAEISEEQKLKNMKFECRYRTPCYEKKKIPYTKAKFEKPKEGSKPSETTKEDKKKASEISEQNKLGNAKFLCKYRKSCYKDEKIPYKETYFEKSKEQKPSKHKIEDQKPAQDMSEEQKLKKSKFECKYRTKCYKDKKIPYAKAKVKIERKQEETKQSKPKKEDKKTSQSKEKSKKEDKKSVAPESQEEVSVREAKFNCKYRKSCYKTGNVPSKEEMRQIQQKVVVPTLAVVDDSELKEEMNLRKKKFYCQYRKSCYDSLKRADLKREWSVKHVQQASTAGQAQEDEKDRVVREAKEANFKCKYRKSCRESDKTKEQKEAQIIQGVTAQSKTKAKKTDIDKKLVGSPNQESKLKQESAYKSKQQQKEKIAEEWKLKQEAQKSEEKLAKDRLKELKSHQENTKYKSEQPQQKDKVEVTDKENKFKCKYRKDCYKDGKLPNLTKKPKSLPTGKKEETVKVVQVKEMSEAEKKFNCKYRKECYKTGIVPDLTKIIHTSKPINDEKVKPITVDVHVTSEADKKFQCKYRKDCYKTGKPPDLSVRKDAKTTPKIQEREKVHISEEDSIREKKFKCLYRKSCYETGMVKPITAHKKPDKEHTDADEEHVHDTKKAKKDCKYRKSCFQDQADLNSLKDKVEQEPPMVSKQEKIKPKVEKESQGFYEDNQKKRAPNVEIQEEETSEINETPEEESSEESSEENSSEEVRKPKRTADSEEDELNGDVGEHDGKVNEHREASDENISDDDNDQDDESLDHKAPSHDNVDNNDSSNEENIEITPTPKKSSAPPNKYEKSADKKTCNKRNKNCQENIKTRKEKDADEKVIKEEAIIKQAPSKSDKPCNKWRKECPEYDQMKQEIETMKEAEKDSEKSKVHIEKGKQPCTKWRRDCPEYEDPRLARQAKDQVKKTSPPLKPYQPSANKKCNKWHKNCPEYAAWKQGKSEDQNQPKNVPEDKQGTEKASCTKWNKGCPEHNKNKQTNEEREDKENIPTEQVKQTPGSKKDLKYGKSEPKTHLEDAEPGPHISTSRPPDDKESTGEGVHSKCGPYRKSCDGDKRRGGDIVRNTDINDSLPCNKYRKSCRQSMGIEDEKNNNHANSKKKLCRKEKK